MTKKDQVTRPTSHTPPVADTAPKLSQSVTQHQRSVALTWVNRGVPVIPCGRDKRPLVPGFGQDAPAETLRQFSDPEQVRSWWSGRYARAHVGLLTGRGPGRGLVVVDLDMAKTPDALPAGRWAGCHGGSDVLERLAAQAGAEWPETYTVMTPSGGLHLYYLQPEDGPLIGCATGDGPTAPHLGPLIDVRGIGGYVIAAGSYSASQGRPYERVSDPAMLPQPLPGWLLERLRPSSRPRPQPAPRLRSLPSESSRAERAADAALSHSVNRVQQAGEGQRNQALFAAARWLGELSPTAPAVLAESTVREELLTAARQTGLREPEALRTIRSGWERGTAGAGLGGAA